MYGYVYEYMYKYEYKVYVFAILSYLCIVLVHKLTIITSAPSTAAFIRSSIKS